MRDISIGLYDADIANYTLLPFNLELMKIAAYYKRKREIVILSPQLSPERHQDFYYYKDYNDGLFPFAFLSVPNFHYGGLAFSNDIYHPLPLEIETMKPDTSIYSVYENKFLNAAQKSKADRKAIFKELTTGEHCRLSLDGKSIWDRYPTQFKDLAHNRNIIFHDKDLAKIDGSLEEIKRILKRSRDDGHFTRVGMKFPVVLSKGEDLLDWSTLPTNRLLYSIEYRGVIDRDNFMEFVSLPQDKVIYSQLDYCVTASSSSENDFVKNHLQEIFRQVIISRNYRAFFTLRYEDNFFKNKNWEKVIELFNVYSHSLKMKKAESFLMTAAEDTMYDFAKGLPEQPYKYYKGKTFTKQEVRDIFTFVRDNYPPLFEDFYNCNLKAIEEGE